MRQDVPVAAAMDRTAAADNRQAIDHKQKGNPKRVFRLLGMCPFLF